MSMQVLAKIRKPVTFFKTFLGRIFSPYLNTEILAGLFCLVLFFLTNSNCIYIQMKTTVYLIFCLFRITFHSVNYLEWTEVHFWLHLTIFSKCVLSACFTLSLAIVINVSVFYVLGLTHIVQLDLDLKYRTNIRNLFQEFDKFPPGAVIGIIREMQPVYRWAHPQSTCSSYLLAALTELQCDVSDVDVNRAFFSLLHHCPVTAFLTWEN